MFYYGHIATIIHMLLSNILDKSTLRFYIIERFIMLVIIEAIIYMEDINGKNNRN